MPRAYSADRRQQDAEAAQAVRERQSVWQLRCKLDQSRREARLVARALQHQYADVKRLEAATRQESQYAAQLESKAAQLLASSPAAELRFQGEGELESLHDENRRLLRDIRALRQSEKERRGEALRLLETAEDCAAVAEVPVDLLGAVGWGQLEVQEVQLNLARASAARSCAAEEHDSLLWSLHSTRQEHRVKVAQLATDESAALSASAERRHFTAEVAACCEAAVLFRNEYNELQAESARDQEDEKACSKELLELESREETSSRDLLTESWLLNQSREAAQSLRGQVGQIDAALSAAAARRRGLVAEEWRGDALQAAGLRELEVQASELQSEAASAQVAALNLKQIREGCKLQSTKQTSMLEMEHSRAEELIASYACAWENVHKLQRAVRAEELQKKAMQDRAREAVLESEAADAQLLKARAKCEVAAAALAQGRQLAMDRGADLRGELKQRSAAQACLSEEIEEARAKRRSRKALQR
ncbi:unnamed protein product [Symbiodinium sp. CCMP2592]|nr:unnamed protein product [Symbiodinium sp. CCMP2592]